MTEPSKWALREAHQICKHWTVYMIDVALALDAARREALEEAERLSDTFTCGICGMDGKAGIAIRALIDQEPKP